MIKLISFLFCFFMMPSFAASVDPMDPPSYAKYKFNQAKQSQIKNKQPAKSAASKTKKNNLNLQSVLYSANRKAAVINGKAYVIGEKVEGAKIIRIKKDSVRLVKKGKVTDLKLNKSGSTITITKSKATR